MGASIHPARYDDETDDDGAETGLTQTSGGVRCARHSGDADERAAARRRVLRGSARIENPALAAGCRQRAHGARRTAAGTGGTRIARWRSAPDWEAVWFEYGKLWLRADDLERAAERFAEAARLMPSFAAALEQPRARRWPRPSGRMRPSPRFNRRCVTTRLAIRSLNNLAVVFREQGRLDEAVEAGRTVIALAPDFVFGHYNLGHALFLQGRFEESRDAYADGHEKRSAEKPGAGMPSGGCSCRCRRLRSGDRRDRLHRRRPAGRSAEPDPR